MSAMDGPDFASLLRRYRRRSGLTQEELAERAGLSAASVSLLERGITLAPQRATVSMLSDALALAPDEAVAFLAQARGPHRSDSNGEFQAPRHAPRQSAHPSDRIDRTRARSGDAAGAARTRDDTPADADRPGGCR